VAQTDIQMLQPLLDIVQDFLKKGLTGNEILWTVLSRGVQLICQREATVMVSPWPSCLICPSCMKPDGTKISTHVREALTPEDSMRQEAHHACSEQLQL
jgi:hypothetical protein